MSLFYVLQIFLLRIHLRCGPEWLVCVPQGVLPVGSRDEGHISTSNSYLLRVLANNSKGLFKVALGVLINFKNLFGELIIISELRGGNKKGLWYKVELIGTQGVFTSFTLL